MELEELLKGIDSCECGKSHPCPIKHVVIRSGAICEIPKLTETYNKILLVADENTYRAAGELVVKKLGEKSCSYWWRPRSSCGITWFKGYKRNRINCNCNSCG